MSIAAARYVRLKDRDADLARLTARSGGDHVHVEPASTFALVVIAAPTLEPEDLAELSRAFGEALSLQIQSIADLVVYDHFRAGERVRGLTQAGEAGWIRVVGEPEPWERALLFGDDALEATLADLDDEIDDAALLARERAEVKALWKGARLVEGVTRPRADGAALTRAVAAAYGLPALPASRTPAPRAR